MPAKILTRRAFALGFATSLASPAAAKPSAKKEVIKPRPSAQDLAFAKFVRALWPDAKDAGVKRKTFDAAFRGVTFDATVVAHTKAQEEFVRPIWNYLDDAVSARRIVAGKAKYEAEKPWIEKARREFGVSEAVIMGIWGMESEFGGFEGADYVIRSLASLAYVKYQGDYFRSELIAALAILEEGDIAPAICWAPGPAPWARPSSCRRASANMRSILTARAGATFGPMRPTRSVRPPIIWPSTAGKPMRPGASKSRCPRAFG